MRPRVLYSNHIRMRVSACVCLLNCALAMLCVIIWTIFTFLLDKYEKKLYLCYLHGEVALCAEVHEHVKSSALNAVHLHALGLGLQRLLSRQHVRLHQRLHMLCRDQNNKRGYEEKEFEK